MKAILHHLFPSACTNSRWLCLPLALLFSAPLGATDDWASLTKEAQRRMALETQLAIEFIEENHFKKMHFDQIDSRELLVNFMKDLDWSRMYFTQADQEEILLRFQDTVKIRYLKEGNLYPAFEIFVMYKQRVLRRAEWVFQRIQQPFDFSTEETFAPDRTEMEFSTTLAELDELWEKRLKFEILGELLGGDVLAGALEKLDRRYHRLVRYTNEIEPHNVQEMFLNSYMGLYDPHTNFFSALDSAEEFNIQISNTLSGIGAILRDEDGYCVIQELVPGGPAELSGQVFPGDKIVQITQEKGEPVEVVDMKLRKVVRMIRGEKGTKVTLTFIPADATDPSERKHVSIVRDEIKLTENLAKARVFEVPMDDGQMIPLGVIELPSFYGGLGGEAGEEATTSKNVEELIRKLKPMGVQGIVLDLRRNGGGLLSEAIRLAGLFIPKGPVVMVKDYTGKTRTDWDSDSKLVWDGPLAVLVSRNSASASEIVAGALQGMQRAIIIGDKATHGKGTVQQPWDLSRSVRRVLNRQDTLGTVKVTVQKFYLPTGASTQNEGVRSDIVIPSFNDYLKIGESDLPNALLWDTIEPAEWNPSLASLPAGPILSEAILAELRARSERRRLNLPEFTFLESHLAHFKKRQDEKEVSLQLEKRKQQKAEDTALKNRMETERKQLAQANPLLGTEVLLDLSSGKEAEHQRKLLETPLPNGQSRINNFFQKLFYYQAPTGGKIHEIYVENFDYEKAILSVQHLAGVLSAENGSPVAAESLEKFLIYMNTADAGRDLQVEKTFTDYLGLEESKANQLLSRLFFQLVELDPDILKTEPDLDIPLRESLRVLADWLQIEDSPFADRVLAARSGMPKLPEEPSEKQAE